MLTPSIGIYQPKDSLLHSLDGRMKLLLLACYIFALFAVGAWPGLLLCLVVLVASYLLGRIPLRFLLKGCKTLTVVLCFLLLVNAFSFHPSPQVIPLVGNLGFRPEGALRGLYLMLRVIALVSSISLLTYTSSLVELTDACSSILKPLGRLGVPVDDGATMVAIILRFIPLCTQEAQRIIMAQQARGAQVGRGNPFRRLRAWVPVLIPLFVSLFRRSEQLAEAMESRCYTGRGRTHLHQQRLKTGQVCTSVLISLALIALGVFL